MSHMINRRRFIGSAAVTSASVPALAERVARRRFASPASVHNPAIGKPFQTLKIYFADAEGRMITLDLLAAPESAWGRMPAADGARVVTIDPAFLALAIESASAGDPLRFGMAITHHAAVDLDGILQNTEPSAA